MTGLLEQLSAEPYRSYTYGYPHKTAYRPLDPAVDLAALWAAEDRTSLFGYLHLPFFEMRCGFCNLFTIANPADDLVGRYLTALEREAAVIADLIAPASAARFAIGGGTPTYLEPGDLERLLAVFPRVFGRTVGEVPTAIETSPATATPERIRLLREAGVRRISIGIQSLRETEVHAIGRRQHAGEVEAALDCLRAEGPPVLNIDLMYGLPGQSPASWLETLTGVLAWAPEEIFCYPLYVRPLTGLGNRRDADGGLNDRLVLYRLARDLLLASGYEQTSMRRFRRVGLTEDAGGDDEEYVCQRDGMVGLGCGARSYTRDLHYSREYAVGRRGVRAIIADYVVLPVAEFGLARHGIRLTDPERLRRFVLQSLLHADGLDLAECRATTGGDPETLPLRDLEDAGLAICTDGRWRLTERGFELSDAIGPWLYSSAVTQLSAAYDAH